MLRFLNVDEHGTHAHSTSIPQMQSARLMQRDGINKKEAEAKLASQMSMEMKRDKADILIENSGDLARTHKQVEKVIPYLKEKGAFSLLHFALFIVAWVPICVCWSVLSLMSFF